ncbi:MAG: UDP-glucose/GDP-mannose dehydrogenase family protein [Gemmatimonadaceae bacterium]|nr:UDP-glucose/GDP-mannose dehydrogenase family protein [Gemmatimonadaceae bacterium]
MKVAIIGTGHTALVTAASLSEVGHSVTLVDTDRGRMARLREGILPVREPALAESMRRNAQELRLEFSTNLSEGIRGAEVIFLALPSPAHSDGMTDMSAWATMAGRLASLLRPYTVVGVVGTLRPGGTQLIRTILEEEGRQSGRDFDVVTLPSMHLRRATLHEALAPERIVVGGDTEHALRVLRTLYAPFLRQGSTLVTVDERSAEAMRYAAAAMQVVVQSFAREVADFCEEGGADIAEVLRELSSVAAGEWRSLALGSAVCASPTAGDLRDARAMTELSMTWGCAPRAAAAALDQVPRTVESILQRLRGAIGDTFDGKRIAMWGLAGWGEDDGDGDSLGLQVARSLRSAGANVVVHAPGLDEGVRTALGSMTELSDSSMAALSGADALIVLCDLPAIRATDFARARRLMARPVVVDPLWLWNQREMLGAGIAYNTAAAALRDNDRDTHAS